MYHILICDDEQDICRALRIYLSDPSYTVHEAHTGKEALCLLEKTEIHLILLDIMMPEMDGITAMVRIREKSNIPIILLTAKGEDADKILGLDLGADDYVTKPFNPAEVVARVRSQLRRYMQLGAGRLPPQVYEVCGLTLDERAKQASLDGEALALTPTEYDILRLLITNPGQVFSPKEIYRHIRGDGFCTENTIAVHIRHLREKIEIEPSSPRYLKMVWGQGYKIEKGNRA